MSQALVNRNRTRNSLRQVMSPRTVLLRMAEDQERAARIKGLKDSRPDLTWAKIAEGVGVKERSAIEWASSGGISEPNAKKLAALFGVPFDYIWRGPESDTPDPFAHVNGGRSQLDRIEAKLDAALAALGVTEPPGGSVEPPGELGRRVAESDSTGQRHAPPAKRPAAGRTRRSA